MLIVTGGSSGLGKDIAESLRSKGKEVLTISRSQVQEGNDHFSCDISDHAMLRSIYKSIKSSKKPVEGLINCAGIASMNLALTTPSEMSEKIVRINLLGTIYTNQVFAPLIIRNKKGRIINFSTIAVNLALPGESIYVASKAGVEAFSRVFANEMSPFNITVNCIAPGPIKTNLLKGIENEKISKLINRQIIKREMSSIDVINIVNLLLHKDSSNITGQIIHVGGV